MLQFGAAGFNFGQINNFFDPFHQLTAGFADFTYIADEAVQAIILQFFLDHFTVTNDVVERGSQFMAEVGEEDGFTQTGSFGPTFIESQLLVGFFPGLRCAPPPVLLGIFYEAQFFHRAFVFLPTQC